MFDLKKTHFSLPLEKPVAAGYVVEQEGLVLLSMLEDGVEKMYVKATAPLNTEVVAGFSLIANAQPDQDVKVVNVVVPAASPLIGNVGATNIVTGTIRASVVGGSDLTVDTTFAGSPADNTVKINLATGDLKFHADEAAATVVFYFTYSLTVAESKARFFQRNINNPGYSYLAQVGCGKGHGEIFTSCFDSSKDYSTAAITVGANGIITTGTALAFPGKVIALPSVDSPFLGIKFDIA